MSERLGDAVLELRTDDTKLRKGIKDAERDASGLADKFSAFGGRARDVGAQLSIGLTAPLALFGVGAVKAASDAAEMESAFDVSFGNAAASARAWAEETGNAMGRSTQEMMSMAASFQDILKKQMDPAAAVEMSKTLTVLTQDLASFKNLSNEDAQQKIFSGLIGETEPLRAVGVVIDEAGVKAKALEMGLGGVNGQLTQGEKVQARAALIMAQLSDAQGDVQRTSGSTANQLKAANAAWDELNVTLGTKLLPVVTPLITGLADMLNYFNGFPPSVQTGTLALLAIGAAIGPLLIGIGALSSGFAAMLPVMTALGPVIGIVSTGLLGLLANPIVLGAAAVIAGIYLAWSNWDKIAPIIDALGATVTQWWTGNVQPVMDWVLAKLAAVVQFFRDVFGVQVKASLAVISALLRGDFSGALSAAQNAVMAMVGTALRLFNQLAPGAIAAMQAMVVGVKQWVQDRLGAVFDWLQGKLGEVGKAFHALYMSAVGNSDIPDMVDEIGAHIARLDGLMVKPALAAIAKVQDGFDGLTPPDIGGMQPDGLPSDLPGPADDPASQQSWTDGFRQTFKDGIQAALNGDLDGFLKGFFERAASRGLNAAIDIVFDAIGGLFKDSGGIGGIIGSLFGSATGGFSGFFAKGGTIPSGSWGIVGERGPEPVIGTSRGTQVLPNSALRSMSSSSGPQTIHVTVSGARGNTEIEAMVRSGVTQGLAGYDRVVGDRVKDHLARRG